MNAGLTGMVLAGGQSRRMGQDKALLVWDGRDNLLSWAVRRLRPVCDPVLILSSDARHAVTGCLRYDDAVPDSGPLGGLVAGLRQSDTEWNLVLACDFPSVPTDALRKLLPHRSPDLDAVVYLAQDRMQPLVALYRKSALPRMEEALSRGNLRMMDLIDSLRTKTILPMKEHEKSFHNVNRPSELPGTAVTILLFAGFREKLGFSTREMHFPDTDAVRAWLASEYPPALRLPYLVAVNEEVAHDNTPLNAGDVVALMPPFAGG